MRTIFACVYPDQNGRVPEYVGQLEATEGLIVLHPNFDWENEQGQKIRETLELGELPTHDNNWCQMVMRDAYTIAASELVIYDVDLNVGADFLYMATLTQKPIIAVAENLTSPPLRYSGYIWKVVRPSSLLSEIAL